VSIVGSDRRPLGRGKGGPGGRGVLVWKMGGKGEGGSERFWA